MKVKDFCMGAGLGAVAVLLLALVIALAGNKACDHCWEADSDDG